MDVSWMAAAACREKDPELFFPADYRGVEVARRICGGCPVARACLEYALEGHVAHGVWGGTSERARRRLAARRRGGTRGSLAPAAAPPDHGEAPR